MDIEECLKEWEDLVVDYKRLEVTNKDYVAKLEEVGELQAACMKEINHQKYRMSIIAAALKRLEKKTVTKDDRVANLEKEIMKRKAMLREINATLPKQNSLYLRIILGNVNVSILNKNDKFKYKDEYEKFKLILSAIAFVLAVANLYIDFRPLQLILLFLLVWYYCTLTIRESILKVNGSRIKGWWRLHHFISTVVAGILLIWPQNEPWNMFRHTFMWFIAYISVVQYMQFRYQSGVLYRLKALGARHNMDITIEGFHSWMWRGLSYLLPFLFGGYVFQLYIAYTLYSLSYHPDATWQIPALSLSFLTIGIGNCATTLIVIPQKLNEQISYLAALFLTLHSLNMYTILQTLHRKYQGGLKLRYKLRAIAYRLSNELTVLEQKWRQNKVETKSE
ncbi:transmembrane protein 120 homolog isoform X1 [Helicoverpa armigera]|uniref:transmembrane protein 120 homolog isoform X1 n=2 Tax=Helicoverpa TaxID=7112 RepID=UPI000B382C4D|nr:transmembrane protein 120 homolog isoform X1 [Helicoverpa armigera]XP_047030143.1 transmembrane protein 120 homolog isoform X1 [Helicoverpa zea]